MPSHKMLLHPADPEYRTDPARLAAGMQQIGLLAAAQPLGNSHIYPCGEHFLDLVTFLGCSPAIELDPPDEPARLTEASMAGRFCHAFITGNSPPRLRADARTPPPRCPACSSPLDDWAVTLAARRPLDHTWQCGNCRESFDIFSLSFRKTAGIASIWLEIRGIHPFEAVPGPTLLDFLQDLSGGPWRTCYLLE